MKKQLFNKPTKGERFECPACHKSSMIMHRKTLLHSMVYVCPEKGCGAKIETSPPREPPAGPTAPPTGGTFPTQFVLDTDLVRQLRKAA